MLVTTAIGRRDRPELPPGRLVDLPGRGAMFVRDTGGAGDAPTVLLLHGWSSTADLNWHPYFDELARHFRVLAIDQRGHGRGLRADGPFRLDDCADDAAALADHLGVRRMLVVGYSMGGAVAQLLWRRRPDLVDGLVFCSTSAAFRSTARLRMLFRAAAGASVVGATGPLSVVAGSAFGAVVRWNGIRGTDRSWGVEQLALHDWGQLVEAGHQIGRYDARSWVGSITAPTAVIVTTRDEVVSSRHQLALARSVPGASVRRIDGGHHHCVTEPADFASVLIPACRDVAARPAFDSVDASAVA